MKQPWWIPQGSFDTNVRYLPNSLWLYESLADIPSGKHTINGNSRILKWRYCTIFLAIFSGDFHLHRPEK
jgi:hypothetical protein